jgi:hypothetical protein
MVVLGVGKNMVRSIRFWCLAFDIAQTSKGNAYSLTDFGNALLGPKGHDPFLEDIRTLWLLHWKLSSQINSPLLAWDYLLNRWHQPELRADAVLVVLAQEAEKSSDTISRVTLEQHFQSFIHTYVATRGPKGEVQEENLDSPFIDLELVLRSGFREIDRPAGKREPVYVFRRERKPEITPELFLYCLCDFWEKRHGSEQTLPLSEIANGHGSPGQLFKLPEDDVRERAENLHRQTGGLLSYSDSALLQQIRKQREPILSKLLGGIYMHRS